MNTSVLNDQQLKARASLTALFASVAVSIAAGSSAAQTTEDVQKQDVLATSAPIKERVLGVCFAAPNDPAAYSLENVTSPVAAANYYLSQFEQRSLIGPTTVSLLRQPKHGVIRLVTEADRGRLFSSASGPIDPNDPGYAYFPDKGYAGKDRATMLVEVGGVKVKVEFFLRSVSGGLGNAGSSPYCSPTGMFWKIS